MVWTSFEDRTWKKPRSATSCVTASVRAAATAGSTPPPGARSRTISLGFSALEAGSAPEAANASSARVESMPGTLYAPKQDEDPEPSQPLQPLLLLRVLPAQDRGGRGAAVADHRGAGAVGARLRL